MVYQSSNDSNWATFAANFSTQDQKWSENVIKMQAVFDESKSRFGLD